MCRRICLALVLFLILGGPLGCIGPAPVEDYTLARAALQAAQSVGAPTHSPGYWHKAERSYRRAQKFFDNQQNDKARNYFRRARKLAEKAENSTRIKKFQSGDAIP